MNDRMINHNVILRLFYRVQGNRIVVLNRSMLPLN